MHLNFNNVEEVPDENFEQSNDVTSSPSETYELPDGTLLYLDETLQRLPSALFFYRPPHATPAVSSPNEHDDTNASTTNNLDASALGLTVVTNVLDLIYTAVSKCDVDVRRSLMSSIVLSGGGAVATGLAQKLSTELSAAMPTSIKVKVIPMQPVERHFAAWIGGSVLGICGTFQQMWISRRQYDEVGS
eukprot:gene11229-14359_t